jgi:hypothetical protein
LHAAICHEALAEGDVLLADGYFSGWFDIALLAQRGVDVVIRKHQLRISYFFQDRYPLFMCNNN